MSFRFCRKELSILTGILVAVGMVSVVISAQTQVYVRFKPGTTMGHYNGTIRGERYLDYVLSAKAGQTLRIRLQQKSGAPAFFNVQRSGEPEAIAADAKETQSWKGVLPNDGPYVVRVYMARADRLSRKSSTFQIGFSIEVE